MDTKKALAGKHSLLNDAAFRLKVILFITRRQVKNLYSGLKKFPVNNQVADEPVIAFSESELWNFDDNEQNWILTAGKIQNLRVAAKELNGIEVPANQTFSFWKHIGNPNFGKGYVVGREIREGCIVPTIAGGLCQLSNALYDAALLAGFEIEERHGHTKIIKGSLAEQGRDATIKWNYVDFRFRAAHAFRMEIDITADKLIVKFKSAAGTAVSAKPQTNHLQQISKLNDCYSCGNTDCFKHPGRQILQPENSVTTFILDDKWREYDDYIQSIAERNDFFILPLKNSRFIKTHRFNWTIKTPANARFVSFAAFRRAIAIRLQSKAKNNIFSAMLQLDKQVARAMARKIPIETTHLVVSQNLLPFLWEGGVFGGRTFDVLMTRLPMEKLHERLDLALSQYPESPTLNDFRAPQALINFENTALTKSSIIITPHKEIAGIFNNKSVKLDWHAPRVKAVQPGFANKILFPASSLGRKGAYEIKQLALELSLSIVVLGKATENDNFWEGVDVETAGGNIFENIGIVIYPAYAENQPRVLLKALAAGIPVITTTAAGLTPANNLTIVPVGDFEKLKNAVTEQLHSAERILA
jgi:hypothetical protein